MSLKHLIILLVESMLSLSQALAGEIRREPVHAEGERELAAVVQVMLQHMPDDPGA